MNAEGEGDEGRYGAGRFLAGDLVRFRLPPDETLPATAQDFIGVVIGPADEAIPEARRASFLRVLILRDIKATAHEPRKVAAAVLNVHKPIIESAGIEDAPRLRALLGLLDSLIAHARSPSMPDVGHS